MLVSTRGRYALRVMIDLAEHTGSECVPLKDVADRQNISRKYLESIMTLLSKNDMVEASSPHHVIYYFALQALRLLAPIFRIKIFLYDFGMLLVVHVAAKHVNQSV